MITLERDGVFMEVATELQASVFERSGYKRVEQASATIITPEVATEENILQDRETAPTAEPEPGTPEPKKRRRKTAAK